MKDHPIQCPEDLEYFGNFMNRLTNRDPDDTEFYQRPSISYTQEFTMEDKLAYDKKEQQVQAILNRWETMWGSK